ncbi:hypothetical protein HUB98_17150 [Paenibacillus barcinonensis]|uniref:Uncharacterized protein n=1 Tax=Paenibacillus barcinonensis TaxID=198119 RepID=A0A2V4UWZ7_PAEBA|nr:hypothetical protein [Paenibacillus barcinonensis]PYE43789.1 hypothetical protein DFQ00_12768 [Paenibacillus barcinonensis]QKS57857.1 hypothetical protein HUB98_17150 [Paenibacillus barcinonensis]
MLSWRRVGLHSILLFCLAVVLAGCGEASGSVWTSYEGAVNEKSFPVPKVANKSDQSENNSDMDYVRYTLSGINEGMSLPEVYLDEIKSWGWTEKQTKRSSNTSSNLHVFSKEGHIVQLAVHDGSFTLMVPRNEATQTTVKSLGEDD